MNTKKTTFLVEGDVIAIKKGMKVYTQLPENQVYSNSRSKRLTNAEVKVEGCFDGFEGEYVVYKTAMNGGGTGHGQYDIYPDGHHVYCESISDPAKRVDFYQSGCFTVMHETVPVLRRLKRNWAKAGSEKDQVLKIRAVMHKYYEDLNSRKHGAVAAGDALEAIETVLGMAWTQNSDEKPKPTVVAVNAVKVKAASPPPTEGPMFYVAEDPSQPGTAYAACMEGSETGPAEDVQTSRRERAKDLASWVRRGARVRLVDGDTMQKMMLAWKPPKSSKKPSTEETQ